MRGAALAQKILDEQAVGAVGVERLVEPLLATYSGHGEPVLGIAFRADGAEVWSGGRDRKIHMWNPKDGKKQATSPDQGGDVHQLLLSGERLFSCSADGTAREYDVNNRKEVRVYRGHRDWIYALAFDASSGRLATGSFDGEVRLWSANDGRLLRTFVAVPPRTRDF